MLRQSNAPAGCRDDDATGAQAGDQPDGRERDMRVPVGRDRLTALVAVASLEETERHEGLASGHHRRIGLTQRRRRR